MMLLFFFLPPPLSMAKNKTNQVPVAIYSKEWVTSDALSGFFFIIFHQQHEQSTVLYDHDVL